MLCRRPSLLICSYLEPEHVETIRRVHPQVPLEYEPGLLRPPRYTADHHGNPAFRRSPEQEARWRQLLLKAEILFDFDQTHREDLPTLAPNVRWIQGTSSGIGQFVKHMDYPTRMPNTVFTTVSGVHARPLAEFVIMTALMHFKGMARMLDAQARRHWERYAGTDLEGRTVGIVGVGRVGQEIARLCRLFGMRVLGTKTTPLDPGIVDEFYPGTRFREMLPRCEVLVLIVPHTSDTERMIGHHELSLLPRGAFLINIARGAVVDEPALIEMLKTGHLGGAALDVFAEEPLPAASPLWAMPNVWISPHSASTSDRENGLIVDLFCENVRRYLDGAPLRNVLDTAKLY